MKTKKTKKKKNGVGMLPSYAPQSMQAAGHECKQARSCTQANRPGRATRVARSRRSATGREVAFAFVFALFAFQNSPKTRYSTMSLNALGLMAQA